MIRNPQLRQAKATVRRLEAGERKEVVEPTARKAFTPRQRLETLMAAKGRCKACQAKVGDEFDIDHIIPLFQGGKHEPDNWQVLCVPCHRGVKTPADATTNAKLRRLKAKNDGTFPESRHKLKSRGFGWTPRSEFR